MTWWAFWKPTKTALNRGEDDQVGMTAMELGNLSEIVERLVVFGGATAPQELHGWLVSCGIARFVPGSHSGSSRLCPTCVPSSRPRIVSISSAKPLFEIRSIDFISI